MTPADLSVTDYQLTELRPDLFHHGDRLLTVCTREHTTWNAFNYGYWACPGCGWCPGEDEGPPMLRCYNCHLPLYTEDRGQAATEIEIVVTRRGRLGSVGWKIAWTRPKETYDNVDDHRQA